MEIPDKLFFDNVNMYDMYLKSEKKNYRILFNKEKLLMKTPIMRVPFGIEKYNDNEIVNLEFRNLKNNYVHNFYSKIKQIDYIFENIHKKEVYQKFSKELPFGFLDEIRNKTYLSSIKNRDEYEPLLRTYLKKSFKVKSNTLFLTKYCLKSLNVIAFVELATLWINDTNYGLSYYLAEVNA